MARRRTVLGCIAGLVAGVVIGSGLTAVATPTDPCEQHTDVRRYVDCRADRQDAALRRIEAELGTTPSETPSAAPEPSPTPTATPSPSVAPTASPTPTASQSATQPSGPSGEAMPGNVAGWTRVYAQDFLTDQPVGSWPGAYANTVYGYDCDTWNIPGGCDTSKRGDYDRKTVVSASNGVMDYHIRTVNGLPKVAAEGPKTNGTENSQTYGRYSVRFRVDAGLTGYKSAWLLWPTNNNWNEGEIDFPEGNLTGNIEGYNHCPGDPARNCYSFDTGVKMASGWHTATVEWLPGSLKFYLDGQLKGSTTSSIPTTPFRWVLQTETNLDGAPIPATVQGHVQVDWMVMWRRT